MADAVLRHLWHTGTAVTALHEAAWRVSERSVHQLLNAPTGAEQDRLTQQWKSTMQQELNTIGITAAILSTVVASAFAWPRVAAAAWWPTLAMWQASLVLSVTSIATVTQHAMALSRLSCHPQGLAHIRELLGTTKSLPGADAWTPRRLQLYTWRAPVWMLNWSIYCFLLGLVIFIGRNALSGQAADIKILIVLTIAFAWSIANYILCTAAVYDRIRTIETL